MQMCCFNILLIDKRELTKHQWKQTYFKKMVEQSKAIREKYAECGRRGRSRKSEHV